MTQQTSLTKDVAPWLFDPATQKILSLLDSAYDGVGARCIGGCVRNTLLGRAVKDIDIATTLKPHEVQGVFCSHTEIKVYETGLAHGTLTVVTGGHTFEVTTLRRDEATYGRHADVAFTEDWYSDAARRDFYMNALYVDKSGQIFDPTARGFDAIDRKAVEFIGDPNERIEEDYLRILRFFRFSAWYGESLDADGLLACERNKHGLGTLSVERIVQELKALFMAPLSPHAQNVLTRADKLGIFSACLDGFDIAPVLRIRQISSSTGCTIQPIWALLFGFVENKNITSNSLKLRLCLSRAEAKEFDLLKQLYANPDMDLNEIAYRYGPQAAQASVLLQAVFQNIAFAPIEYNELESYVKPIFPIKGRDLLEFGLSGPALGEAFRKLESYWINSNFSMTKHTLLSLADGQSE